MYEYKCEVLRIVDGDTVDVDIDLGFGTWLRKQRVRLLGIDTPESRTSDPIEKIFGKAASKRLEELLPVGSSCVLKSHLDEEGKYGRILGDFYIYFNDEWKVVGSILVDEGYAVVYTGQNKELIKEAHLANRTRLINEGKVSL